TIFTGPKITVPYRSKINSFAYNESEWFCRSDSYVVTLKDFGIELKYILALLNSKLYYIWLYHKGKRKGETLELFQVPLSEIPIKRISEGEQKPFITIVDQILTFTKDEDYLSNSTKQAKVKEYEYQIDQMVYELYGLTPEEIDVVESSAK
ncbi:TaqI-like C-terminal specificity domain-containing protein, partial [Chloroflexota bacterium]